MARTVPVIDVDNRPALRWLVDELKASRTPVILRFAGEEVAVVSPPEIGDDRDPSRAITDDERDAFRRTAGGWEGSIDIDAFLEDTYTSRRLPPRPRVELE